MPHDRRNDLSCFPGVKNGIRFDTSSPNGKLYVSHNDRALTTLSLKAHVPGASLSPTMFSPILVCGPTLEIGFWGHVECASASQKEQLESTAIQQRSLYPTVLCVLLLHELGDSPSTQSDSTLILQYHTKHLHLIHMTCQKKKKKIKKNTLHKAHPQQQYQVTK